MESTERSTRNKTLGSQEREIVYNILKFAQQEASENKLLIDLKKAQERVAAMTGANLRTIKRIAKEGREVDSGLKAKFSEPSMKGKRVSKVKLDQSDQAVLRRFIINFQNMEPKAPTIKQLHDKFVEEHGYKGCRETLRKEIYELGFGWVKTDESNRALLVEQSSTSSQAEAAEDQNSDDD